MTFNFDAIVTEQPNPATVGIDSRSTADILRLMNDEDKTVAFAIEKELPAIAAAVDAVVSAMKTGGRLIYIGAGTSGRLGVLDAAECPPTFGTDPKLVVGVIAGGESALVRPAEGVEDDAGAAVGQLRQIDLSAADVLVGIAASGRTPYVLAALEYANALGAFTVAVTSVPGSAVAGAARVAITPVVGPEVIAGSTRLKAGTAAKMVLNMLTTAAMVRLGKVYGNRMVDLKPTNVKLWERAKRIVAEAAGVSKEDAEDALNRCGRSAKTAIVMLKTGCAADDAERRLQAADGFVSKAIGNP
ncbi:N-acetylmuramic acid 6-phosphate etherase [Anaeroselena agilis]|uniref:N-acetylmuramic acid 6-phosphate etherase n=1 Tax=Anaeroselena agilis TaxID=3063788 RepID=A0ABU3NY46_9FIRM|nr:N-acetylmuramic acid 6-phosphate etherase [Selenomonadales bacterium 4137-cl]